MRITMGMISNQYGRNLNSALSELNKAADRATTFRKFAKASEDPFSAMKAYRLRREFQENSNYQDNLSDVNSQIQTAQSSMMSLNSLLQEASSGDSLQAVNGTMSSEDRAVIATKLRTLQQTVLAEVNLKYSDKYVFGGSNTSEPPFSTGDDGALYYRGVNVNTGELAGGPVAALGDASLSFGREMGGALNGYTITVADGGAPGTVSIDNTAKAITVDLAAGATRQDLTDALKGASGLVNADGDTLDFSNVSLSGAADAAVSAGDATGEISDTIGEAGLKTLAEEQTYLDLGMGLKFKADGSIDEQSVFNSAIPGLSFLGYGQTADGVSNNAYTLLGQIANQLDGTAGEFSMDSIQPYLDRFSEAGDRLLAEITKSGTKSNFLTSIKKDLESAGDNVNEKIVDNEYLDSADAILDLTMQQYAYTAALQMGTKIMQSTLLDFMT